MHNMVFRFDDDGNIEAIYHPNDTAARQALGELGRVVSDQRAGYVWPKSKVLRSLFKGLRKLFGRKGRVADWTRGWRCAWIVVDAETMEQLPGVYDSHDKAVEAEVSWSLDHGYPKRVLGNG